MFFLVPQSDATPAADSVITAAGAFPDFPLSGGVCIVFSFTLLMQLLHLWDNFGMWITETSARMEDRFLPWIYSAFQLVIAIVFYVLTYRKIKTQKY